MAAQLSPTQFLSASEPWSFLNKPGSNRSVLMNSDLQEFLNLNSVDPFHAEQRNSWRPVTSTELSEKTSKKIQRPISPSEFIEVNSNSSMWTSSKNSPKKNSTIDSVTLSPYPTPSELHVQNANLSVSEDSVFKFSGPNISLNIEEEITGQSLYKTELCRSFAETGNCRYGTKCQFAHGKAELRSLLRHPKYKTEVCKTFHTIGTCPYGNRCRFIHTTPENARRLIQTFGEQRTFGQHEFHCVFHQQSQDYSTPEQGPPGIPAPGSQACLCWETAPAAPPPSVLVATSSQLAQQQTVLLEIQPSDVLLNSANQQIISQAKLNKLMNTNTNDWSTSWKSNSNSSVPTSALFKPAASTSLNNKAPPNKTANPNKDSTLPSAKISSAAQKEKKAIEAPGLAAPSPKEVERRLAFFQAH